jgi:prolyl-tRNA editing enzyme YbaK/EbsC (Cys-tRNA(Pro) deacylase)
VLEFEAGTRTAADAAAAIDDLLYRDERPPRLVVASGDKGVDDKKAAAVIGEKIGRVNADFARETTGFAIGGVPPVGHARPPIVLIDETLLRFDNIWAAAGTPYAVFRLTPADLVALTRGLIVDAANS